MNSNALLPICTGSGSHVVWIYLFGVKFVFISYLALAEQILYIVLRTRYIFKIDLRFSVTG